VLHGLDHTQTGLLWYTAHVISDVQTSSFLGGVVNRLTVVVLCLVFCLIGFNAPTASAASRLATADKTALLLCLRQVSLMHDAYESIFAKYPTLTTFSTVAADEVAMLATLKKILTKYRIAVPANTRAAAAQTLASSVTNISMAHSVAINLEQSTATMMTQLLQTTDNKDVAKAEALVKSTSLGSHTSAFAAEQTTITPPPTPPTTLPATRPFPAPVTTRTVTIPASIDATGSSDVSTALTGLIASVPDGSLVNFPSTGVYRIDKAIEFGDRHNLVLDGNGCTLKYTSVTGTTEDYALWRDAKAGSDIWIRNFVLIGSSPYPGVYTPGTSPTGGEWQHAVAVRSSRFEVSGCTISAVWGDGFYVTSNPSDVWIHDNHVISAGRNGLSVISGTNVIAERNAFDTVGFITFDVEPNYASETSTNIIFRNNTAGVWGLYFFAVVGNPTSSTLDGIVVDGNTVTGSSLDAYVDNRGGTRITHVTFTNNVGKNTAAGPVLHFKHVDGLTVTGNVQPLSSGVLTRIIDCTGVVTS
jgi:hypothetical protein